MIVNWFFLFVKFFCIEGSLGHDFSLIVLFRNFKVISKLQVGKNLRLTN